eukprot:TRINITY_DN64005_c0_g1_i1.p1 TRINITY_DN64005_c0_g1~~TRINITY_DN64005_c0_g1_i1.p1  ORF type:complete len:333 (+),score=43.20 TRINITY_DN64005_c0_g1_i1:36-1034(+)
MPGKKFLRALAHLLAFAADSSSFHELEQEILRAHNHLRANPEYFAEKLTSEVKHFSGRTLWLPADEGRLTQEGPAARLEAVRELRRLQVLPELRWSHALYLAARDHTLDQGERGVFGHTGTDASSYQDRIERYCTWTGGIGESITYGERDAGERTVLELFVDDGVADRGHRKNIINHRFQLIGISCAPHASFHRICTMVYAAQVQAHHIAWQLWAQFSGAIGRAWRSWIARVSKRKVQRELEEQLSVMNASHSQMSTGKPYQASTRKKTARPKSKRQRALDVLARRSREQLMSLPGQELKEYLAVLGGSCSACFDKEDIVDRLLEVISRSEL